MKFSKKVPNLCAPFNVEECTPRELHYVVLL
jgi:hypothetical protein